MTIERLRTRRRHSPEPGVRRESAMLRDVRAGLARAQKEIPAKYFYDECGSALFEEITRLDEYYLTRTERGLLEELAADWLAQWPADAVVELGAGSAEKTRLLLDRLRPGARYIPVDISRDFLERSAGRLRAEYPQLRIEPRVADITRGPGAPSREGERTLFVFLGSTIGNFADDDAIALLRGVAAAMREGDALLIGADLVKDRALLEAAYNDARGVTAAFNLNVLHVLNRELGADFDPAGFRHVAFYNEHEQRIEMHLLSLCEQAVNVPGIGVVQLARGETIRTELSNKYTRERLARLLRSADLSPGELRTDAAGAFALVLATRARRSPQTLEEAAAWIRAHVAPRAVAVPRVGAEYELLVQHAEDGSPALWLDGHGPLARWLSRFAVEHHVHCEVSDKGVPKYRMQHGGTLTLEPGGQLEYASPPFADPEALITDLETVTRALEESAAADGLRLLAVGIDPHNTLEQVPLQLPAERYLRMDAYFSRYGEAGARMMRQTASLQLNIDVASSPDECWKLANLMSPYLTALFANSRTYAGMETAYASYRARTWQELDPARTGVLPCSGDLAAEYAAFALAAPRMLHDGNFFSEDDWREHLSTLFPDVRPRGYLELRCIDSMPVARAADAIRLVCGLLWNEQARAAALELVEARVDGLNDVACRLGMEDETLRRTAERLVELGMEGYAALNGATSAARTLPPPPRS